MAVDYGHRHCGCCNIEDFEAGANAVLETIENVLDAQFAHFYDISEECYKVLKGVISELRGEKEVYHRKYHR